MENSLLNLRQAALGYAFTLLFSTSIALVLWVIKVDESLTNSLIISHCIGFSICTMYVALWAVISSRLSHVTASILISATGIVVGLILSGLVVHDDTLNYFRGIDSGVLLALFFGTIGTIIYQTQMRLVETKAELALTAASEADQARKATQAQLGLLQAQIEPHFLFNTLSNIHSLIDERPDDAKQTIENLTTLLRQSLNRTRENWITLAEEVNILRAYLDLQKIRMGSRLTYDIDIPAELHNAHIPPLLIQPLVENAVVHGLETEQGGHVSIQAKQQKDRMQIVVADNGVGIDQARSNPAKNGIGLSNITERIQTLYKGDASLTITERASQQSEDQPGGQTDQSSAYPGCVFTLDLPKNRNFRELS